MNDEEICACDFKTPNCHTCTIQWLVDLIKAKGRQRYFQREKERRRWCLSGYSGEERSGEIKRTIKNEP